jgi:hypothetical protein
MLCIIYLFQFFSMNLHQEKVYHSPIYSYDIRSGYHKQLLINHKVLWPNNYDISAVYSKYHKQLLINHKVLRPNNYMIFRPYIYMTYEVGIISNY